jgi:hypothetical protein
MIVDPSSAAGASAPTTAADRVKHLEDLARLAAAASTTASTSTFATALEVARASFKNSPDRPITGP